jgi:threonine/homoserine/homoserine lactone efflux protein
MQSFPLALILTSIPFMTSMGITPGPNNILVAGSGVNFGFRATIPHILGITIGYPLMLFIVGIGLAKIFIAVPLIHLILKYISIAYLLYLAYRISVAASMGEARRQAKPLTFLQHGGTVGRLDPAGYLGVSATIAPGGASYWGARPIAVHLLNTCARRE